MNTLSEPLQEQPGLRAGDLPGLTPAQHEQLLALIRASHVRQEQDYADALEHGLGLVPAFLRGTVRRMILG